MCLELFRKTQEVRSLVSICNYMNNLYDEYPSRLIRLSLPPKLRATNCSQTKIIIKKKRKNKMNRTVGFPVLSRYYMINIYVFKISPVRTITPEGTFLKATNNMLRVPRRYRSI